MLKSKPNKPKPNLANYNKTYKAFRWKQAEKDVIFFDKNKKQLNIAYNALTKHILKGEGNKTALLWQDKTSKCKKFSFSDIERESNKFANLLQKIGIKKSDRVFIFLPRIPELYFSFFGILKAGAIAGTLFPAFGSEGIETRLKKGEVKVLVTTAELLKRLEKLKLPDLKHVIVIGKKRKGKTQTKSKKKWKEISYSEISKESSRFETVKTNKKDSAIMLFTSATSYTPVAGIVLPHKALIQQAITAKWVLDLHPDDVYWCTADPGWITGIVYGIIAPLALGIPIISYEGRFDADVWYKIMENYKINVLYTAPTAVRMLMQSKAHKKYNLNSLRHICSVGEALNPSAIEWAEKNLKLKIYDTYWQTETGAMVICNYRCMKIKKGSMGKPVPGIKADIIDDKGRKLKAGKVGNLVLKTGWPAMMSKIWNRPSMYRSYFSKDKKWFITKDLAYKNKEGYYFFASRADDAIKTAGERVNPFEVESALMKHPRIAETVIVSKPDPVRGEIIAAFAVLKKGHKAGKPGQEQKLKEEIKLFVKRKLAGHAYPREIIFVSDLPKTRSGKIVRRILKNLLQKKAAGDISTLQNPECVGELKKVIYHKDF